MFKYNKIIFILIPVSLIWALLWGGRLPYFVFASIVTTVALSFLWIKHTVKRINVFQKSIKHLAYVGDNIKIKTVIYNDSIFPLPCIEIENDMISKITGKAVQKNIVSIMPLSSKGIDYNIECKYRGVYDLGPINVKVSDVFGFFTFKRQVKCDGKLIIYPKIAIIQRFNIKPRQMFGTTTTNEKSNEDYTSISDIKRYNTGDSFKNIHWKVSAKKGELYVKNFDMSGGSESYIFLNLYYDDYDSDSLNTDFYRRDIEEKLVEYGVSIVRYMLSRNISTGLYANSKRMIYVKGRDLKEFKIFLDELIGVKSDGSTTIEDMIDSKIKLLPKGSSIVIITPIMSSNLIEKILSLKYIGFDVVAIYIIDSHSSDSVPEETIKKLLSSKVKLLKVGIGDDVNASLEG
jgi:uncharacterized protein (DUF58 family)